MLGCKDAASFVLPASNVPLHVAARLLCADSVEKVFLG
jgi:hypothetical protein